MKNTKVRKAVETAGKELGILTSKQRRARRHNQDGTVSRKNRKGIWTVIDTTTQKK